MYYLSSKKQFTRLSSLGESKMNVIVLIVIKTWQPFVFNIELSQILLFNLKN